MLARVAFPGLENPRFAYAVISLKVLPVGLMGVMIAAIFSATLSTLSNEFTMLSSVLTNDFYARKINTGASEKHLGCRCTQNRCRSCCRRRQRHHHTDLCRVIWQFKPLHVYLAFDRETSIVIGHA